MRVLFEIQVLLEGHLYTKFYNVLGNVHLLRKALLGTFLTPPHPPPCKRA